MADSARQQQSFKGQLGGFRPGAGRPPGAVTKRKDWRHAMDEWIALGKDAPLMVILKIMDRADNDADKLEAAKAAAPYCHPKLAAHLVKHDDGTTNHEDWLKSVAGIDSPKLVEPPKDMTDDDLVAVQQDKELIVIDHE